MYPAWYAVDLYSSWNFYNKGKQFKKLYRL